MPVLVMDKVLYNKVIFCTISPCEAKRLQYALNADQTFYRQRAANEGRVGLK